MRSRGEGFTQPSRRARPPKMSVITISTMVVYEPVEPIADKGVGHDSMMVFDVHSYVRMYGVTYPLAKP